MDPGVDLVHRVNVMLIAYNSIANKYSMKSILCININCYLFY